MYKELLMLIGEIPVIFNHIEEIIFGQIWEELHVTNLGLGPLITSHLGYQQKCDLLRALLIENNGASIDKEFKDIYTKLVKCGEKRNYYLHSIYAKYNDLNYDDELKSIDIVNFREAITKGQKIQTEKLFKKVNIEDLKVFIEELKKTRDELIGFLELS